MGRILSHMTRSAAKFHHTVRPTRAAKTRQALAAEAMTETCAACFRGGEVDEHGEDPWIWMYSDGWRRSRVPTAALTG